MLNEGRFPSEADLVSFNSPNIHFNMKKLFVLGALLYAALPGKACDQCGCGLLLGVQPYDNVNNFGLQWRMRYLKGVFQVPASTFVMKHSGAAQEGATIPATYVELYSVVEATGQIWVSHRTSLTANIPLLNNYQSVGGVRRADIYAVGDPMLLARYALFASTSGPDTTRLRHRFTVGLGLKFPVGRTDMEQYGELLDHDLQPGTGTWDPLMSLEYMLRGAKWGASAGAVGRYNGESADGHRFGPSANLTAEIFRIFPIGKFKVLPSVGGYSEYALPDEDKGVIDKGTGGNVLFSQAGLRLWWERLGLSFAWQHALVNDLGSRMIPNRERLTAGITYNIEHN